MHLAIVALHWRLVYMCGGRQVGSPHTDIGNCLLCAQGPFLGEILSLCDAKVRSEMYTLIASDRIISGSITATAAYSPYTESQQNYQEITTTISCFCSVAALHDTFLLTSIYYDTSFWSDFQESEATWILISGKLTTKKKVDISDMPKKSSPEKCTKTQRNV